MEPLLIGRDITFSYGGHTVLEHAGFTLHSGQKVALVGPNGAGKTTLFRLLVGQLRPDLGDLERRPTLRIGYLPQVPDIEPAMVVSAVLASPSPEVERLEAELRDLEAWMARPDAWDQPDANEKMTRYGEVQAAAAEERSKSSVGNDPILSDLGVTEDLLEEKFGDLSGGEKSKVLLARALANAKQKDLLLLDEPTNHMDIATIEWIEEYLTEISATVVLSSHDKFLLDNVANAVLEVDNRRLIGWEGNYSDYRGQKEAYQRALEAKRRKNFDEVKRQLGVIEEFKARHRYGLIKAREKIIASREADMPTLSTSGGKAFKLVFQSAAKSGRSVLAVEGVKKSHGGRTLFRNVTFEIEKGDKIGLIGPNGCGKTTLLELLVGRQDPDAGRVERSQTTHIGYFAQHHSGMDFERTLYEEVRSIREPPPPEEWARGLLGRFGFSGPDAFKKVGQLSGGERARLSLAKFIADEHNFLVLDEPTNHLDIESQEIVAQALKEYPGSVLIVSHNRSFLNDIVNKVALVAHQQVAVFKGNFQDSWTAAKMGEFMAEQGLPKYRVRLMLRDWETGKRWGKGETIQLTGVETQAFRRLLRWAEGEGRIERVDA